MPGFGAALEQREPISGIGCTEDQVFPWLVTAMAIDHIDTARLQGLQRLRIAGERDDLDLYA
ncbi:hypothetical protein D3C84_746620 [compost metagenome]